MTRHEQVPVKLLAQQPLEVKQSFIEWNEKYIRYCVEMTTNEWKDKDDASMGSEIAQIFFDKYAPKSKIAGIEKAWNVPAKKWVLYISISGVSDDWRLYFNKQSACDERLKQLIDYIFG